MSDWAQVKFLEEDQRAEVKTQFFKLVVDNLIKPGDLEVGNTYSVFWSPDPEETPQDIMEQGNSILDVDNLPELERRRRRKDGPLKGFYNAVLLSLNDKEDIEMPYKRELSGSNCLPSNVKRTKVPSAKAIEAKLNAGVFKNKAPTTVKPVVEPNGGKKNVVSKSTAIDCTKRNLNTIFSKISNQKTKTSSRPKGSSSEDPDYEPDDSEDPQEKDANYWRKKCEELREDKERKEKSEREDKKRKMRQEEIEQKEKSQREEKQRKMRQEEIERKEKSQREEKQKKMRREEIERKEKSQREDKKKTHEETFNKNTSDLIRNVFDTVRKPAKVSNKKDSPLHSDFDSDGFNEFSTRMDEDNFIKTPSTSEGFYNRHSSGFKEGQGSGKERKRQEESGYRAGSDEEAGDNAEHTEECDESNEDEMDTTVPVNHENDNFDSESSEDEIEIVPRRLKPPAKGQAGDSAALFAFCNKLWKPEELVIRSPTGLPPPSKKGAAAYPRMTPQKVDQCRDFLRKRIIEENPKSSEEEVQLRLNRVGYILGQKISSTRRSFKNKKIMYPSAEEVLEEKKKRKEERRRRRMEKKQAA